MYNYSVIIPHRNSVSKLKRAVASIPKREDIEVIVIDNSTVKVDLSFLENLNHHKLLYSDITKGAGHARNIGLDASCAKWILFLDADDYFAKGAFGIIDNYISSSNDIVFFNVKSVNCKTGAVSERAVFYSNIIENYKSGINKSQDLLRYKFVTPWGKLFLRKFIFEKGIKFDEVPASNDMMFSIKTGHHAKKIDVSLNIIYVVTESNNSLTKTKTSKNQRSRFLVSIRQYHFMNSINRPDLRFYLLRQVLASIRFGVMEFFWYVSIVKKEKVNVFLGLNNLLK